jgi:hypothetical protein
MKCFMQYSPFSHAIVSTVAVKYAQTFHHVYWQAAAYVIEKADVVGGNLLALSLDWDRNMCMAFGAPLGPSTN